jgi:uncharacterized protein
MLTRERALEIVRSHVKRENLLKHIYAVEAIMRGTAAELGEDVDIWALAGLLHDADFDETFNDPARHGNRSVEILQAEAGIEVTPEIIRAIKAHNPEHTGTQPESRMEYALLAADAISGLIIAMALIIPTKKLSDVKPENIPRRFKEKDFARNCNRTNMMLCEKAGMNFEQFSAVALKSLQVISSELGL